ncbi:hypothetical protein [Okeania sp. SIO2B3]|uniref:hypothetical protein n=1 Tax=Okeania sp. SIO2B3 TaxID=2607784 RepID=UPI0013C093DC|nr:hypothetical protein [Okeania sp. SIO2B3]NET42651.1 hypothetical protein [Okeania sp. SIO2B3]
MAEKYRIIEIFLSRDSVVLYGRRQKAEGRRKKEEGRRKRKEGKILLCLSFQVLNLSVTFASTARLWKASNVNLWLSLYYTKGEKRMLQIN